jgi:hypothetical protein
MGKPLHSVFIPSSSSKDKEYDKNPPPVSSSKTSRGFPALFYSVLPHPLSINEDGRSIFIQQNLSTPFLHFFFIHPA